MYYLSTTPREEQRIQHIEWTNYIQN